MKKIMNFVRYSFRPIAGVVVAAFLLTACKKDISPDYSDTPAAGFMAFNLAPDQLAVGFTLSGNILGNVPLGYTNFTGAYLPIYVGSREVRSFDYNTSSTIALTNVNFADSMYYSAFLVGANGSYRNVVVNDQLNGLTAAPGKAWVRYINAIPDSSSATVVTIAGNGDNTNNESAPYGNVSSFKQVSAGSVNTSISNGGNISATRTITFEENRIYTVLFVGQPNQADPNKLVQVKFIQNGIVTP